MNKKLMQKTTVCLAGCILLQVAIVTKGFSYCVARDTESQEIPLGSDLWVENCCDGRPAHWPSSAMPIPVYIWDGTPFELEVEITDAVQTWNNVESSFFEMEVVGYTSSKNAILGAVVMGFDTSLCGENEVGCMKGGSSNPAISVNSSPDGFQIQSSTIFADAHSWNDGSHPDPLWVMTHELGHTLGILHPGDTPRGKGGRGCGPEFTEATMECCSRQTGNDGSLELDDMAAATYLYPKWKYTVEVVDKTNNPMVGAAVWMQGTCFPHDGDDLHEGGMVFGDIPSCLVGDLESSNTYYQWLTYATGFDGKTGAFKVMHDNFCFTVVAEGFSDSFGCQILPAQGNYLTTVVMNRPPVCDANGPYTAECQGDVTNLTLDARGSNDPDPSDALYYSWTTDCPGGSFNDLTSSTPMLSVDSSTGSLMCTSSLLVTDSDGAAGSCSSTVTIQDSLSPSIVCPANVTIECDQSSDPVITGLASATDVCDSSPTITFSDAVIPGTCPEESIITRTWTATDYVGNTSSCEQTIEIVDTTPPIIQAVTASPNNLWPPNHKMITVNVSATATDNCDSSPVCTILNVNSNESMSGGGDGNTIPDWLITGNLSVDLRAERSGRSNGRDYTITVSCTDGCGNSSVETTPVTVQHNR